MSNPPSKQEAVAATILRVARAIGRVGFEAYQQESVANYLGCHRSLICLMEKGERTVSPKAKKWSKKVVKKFLSAQKILNYLEEK